MAASPSSPAPSSSDLVDRLVQTSFAVVAHLTRVAAAHDLSLSQLRVLAILRDHEPTMAALATHLGLERSSVSGLVDRAVRRGLVRRRDSPEDGRTIRVDLTDEGQELAMRITAEVDALLGPLVAGLGDREHQRLAGLLGRLGESPTAATAPG